MWQSNYYTMDLSPVPIRNDRSIEAYRKMAYLQEQLHKSEEERMKLEEKLKLLMKAFREEEEIRFANLQERYFHFLEDCCWRNERNDKILRSLDKVENGANKVFAKTERLKLLRDHYEAYLERIMPHWKQHSTITYKPTYGASSLTSDVAYKPTFSSKLTGASAESYASSSYHTRYSSPEAGTAGVTSPEGLGRLHLTRDDPKRVHSTRNDLGRLHSTRDDSGRMPSTRDDLGRLHTPKDDPGRLHSSRDDTDRLRWTPNRWQSLRKSVVFDDRRRTDTDDDLSYSAPLRTTSHYDRYSAPLVNDYSTRRSDEGFVDYTSRRSDPLDYPSKLDREPYPDLYGTNLDKKRDYDVGFRLKELSINRHRSSAYEDRDLSEIQCLAEKDDPLLSRDPDLSEREVFRPLEDRAELDSLKAKEPRMRLDVGKLSPDATSRFESPKHAPERISPRRDEVPVFDTYADEKKDTTNEKNNLDGEDVSPMTKKSVLEHQRSIDKLKAALSIDEEDHRENSLEIIHDERIIQKEETEASEKTEEETDMTENSSEVWQRLPTVEEPQQLVEEYHPVEEVNVKSRQLEIVEEPWQGDELESKLEGIVSEPEEAKRPPHVRYEGEPADYDGETYPDSYYEQPPPRSQYPSNIASNVILEEDEFDQDDLTPHLYMPQPQQLYTLPDEEPTDKDFYAEEYMPQEPHEPFIAPEQESQEQFMTQEHGVAQQYVTQEHDIHQQYMTQEHDIPQQYMTQEHGVPQQYIAQEHDIPQQGMTQEHDIPQQYMTQEHGVPQQYIAQENDSPQQDMALEHEISQQYMAPEHITPDQYMTHEQAPQEQYTEPIHGVPEHYIAPEHHEQFMTQEPEPHGQYILQEPEQYMTQESEIAEQYLHQPLPGEYIHQDQVPPEGYEEYDQAALEQYLGQEPGQYPEQQFDAEGHLIPANYEYNETSYVQYAGGGYPLYTEEAPPEMQQVEQTEESEEGGQYVHTESAYQQELNEQPTDEQQEAEQRPRPQTVLSHLLDSESESYNIEHGVAPADDSDFDFSLGKQ